MPRIRCHYIDCIFNDDGICTASAVELDPDTGCLTYSQSNKMNASSWDDDDDLDDSWDDLGFEDTAAEDDDWLDDDEDDF
jgi:hypothetical protein